MDELLTELEETEEELLWELEELDDEEDEL
jgi:hypothetical protein